MVLVTVKIKNKTGETLDAGDSVCELSFRREGACPDRRGAHCTSAANCESTGTRTVTPLLTTLTITGFIVLITQLSTWRW
jgi:hypothetical protein